VDGVLYEEFFITDYDIDIAGLYDCLGEYESLDELNYLASLLSDMNDWELPVFEAAVQYGEDTGSVKALINLAQNLDNYCFYRKVKDHQDLGYYLVDELGYMEIPERMEMYFDYEAYGRDCALNEGGVFVNGGYVVNHGGSVTEHYNGSRDDIPEEYRVFAYPDPPERMPIKQQLEMYGRMALGQTAANRTDPAHERG
jgi:hypothetical protein